MAENSTHSDYDTSLAAWLRARDVLAGEDAVKAAGVEYLPRLDSQSDEEYAAYKARASFFGATARTLEEYLDLVRYARRVVGEVLAVGRAGSLVLWEQSGRPVVSLWRAENILNWTVERVGKRVGPGILIVAHITAGTPPSFPLRFVRVHPAATEARRSPFRVFRIFRGYLAPALAKLNQPHRAQSA
jgi:hypothetical protein